MDNSFEHSFEFKTSCNKFDDDSQDFEPVSQFCQQQPLTQIIEPIFKCPSYIEPSTNQHNDCSTDAHSTGQRPADMENNECQNNTERLDPRALNESNEFSLFDFESQFGQEKESNFYSHSWMQPELDSSLSISDMHKKNPFGDDYLEDRTAELKNLDAYIVPNPQMEVEIQPFEVVSHLQIPSIEFEQQKQNFVYAPEIEMEEIKQVEQKKPAPRVNRLNQRITKKGKLSKEKLNEFGKQSCSDSKNTCNTVLRRIFTELVLLQNELSEDWRQFIGRIKENKQTMTMKTFEGVIKRLFEQSSPAIQTIILGCFKIDLVDYNQLTNNLQYSSFNLQYSTALFNSLSISFGGTIKQAHEIQRKMVITHSDLLDQI